MASEEDRHAARVLAGLAMTEVGRAPDGEITRSPLRWLIRGQRHERRDWSADLEPAAVTAMLRVPTRGGQPRSRRLRPRPVVGHVRLHRVASRDPGMVEPGDLGQPQSPHHGLRRLVEHSSHGPDLVQADAVERHRERGPGRLGGIAVMPGMPSQSPADLDAPSAGHAVRHRVEAGEADELAGLMAQSDIRTVRMPAADTRESDDRDVSCVA